MKKHAGRLHRLLDRLLDQRRGKSGHGLSAQAARQSARQPVVDVRRGALRLSPRAQRPAADERRSAATATRHVQLEWSQVVREIDEQASRSAGRLAAVLSPHLTVEEAYLLGQVRAQRRSAGRWSCWARCRSMGEDETFKNGFTIRAEKCPNRRGVEEIVSHFMGRVATLDDLLAGVEAGEIRGRVGQRRIQARRGSTPRRPSGWPAVELPDRAGYVRLAAVGAGHVSACRARRLPSATARTSIMPTGCKASTGRFVRRPACASKRACIGELLGNDRAVQGAPRAGRSGRARSRSSPRRPTRSVRWASI